MIIGEQYQGLLSSFSGTDNSFYILVDNHNYNQSIDEVLEQMTDQDPAPILIRPFMTVCVKYDGRYTRAWIQSIDSLFPNLDIFGENWRNLDDQYHVFYVDWGNEEKVTKNKIRICPESIRYIPWLANRVKFHNEQLTSEEFDGKTTLLSHSILSIDFEIEFWKTIENDYCQVFVLDQFLDYYSIEIKYDYLAMIRKRRAISSVNNNALIS